jgi:hypothetical protein
MATSLNSKLKPPWQLILAEENATDFVEHVKSLFGSAVEPAFDRISIFFFFAKIECGLYFLDRFDVLMSKIIFKK